MVLSYNTHIIFFITLAEPAAGETFEQTPKHLEYLNKDPDHNGEDNKEYCYHYSFYPSWLATLEPLDWIEVFAPGCQGQNVVVFSPLVCYLVLCKQSRVGDKISAFLVNCMQRFKSIQ